MFAYLIPKHYPAGDAYNLHLNNGLICELTELKQRAVVGTIICNWRSGIKAAFSELVVFFQTAPTVAHSFTFYKTGAILDNVVVAASANYGHQQLDFSLVGQTDHIMIRHDTTAQDAGEGAHVDEGGRIFAGIVPSLYP